MNRLPISGVLVILLLCHITTLFADDFPMRRKFPQVPVYSAEQLKKNYENSIIVDVRSEMEYELVRINTAVNIPISRIDFIDKLALLRPKDGKHSIVFYCNGHDCEKSYQAVEIALKHGYKNVVTYDAGVYGWVREFPELGTLLGKSPVNKSQLISEERFNAKLLDYASFEKMSRNANVVVVDVRDPMQRSAILPINGNPIYLKKFISYLKNGVWKDQPLLIYDAVGKQVRWLQYHLEMHGYTNYYFLKEGVQGFNVVQSAK